MQGVYLTPVTLQKVGQGDKHDKILYKLSFQHKRTILQFIQEFKAPSLCYLSTYQENVDVWLHVNCF